MAKTVFETVNQKRILYGKQNDIFLVLCNIMSETVKGLKSFTTELTRLYKEIIFRPRHSTAFLLCMITALFLSFSGGSGMVPGRSGYCFVVFMFYLVLC